MEVHRSKAGVAARVDAVKWLQVHLYVQCQAVVGAMSGYLDPESADFAKASEGVFAWFRGAQLGVIKRVVQSNVDTGRRVNAMAHHVQGRQGPDDGLFKLVNVLFYKITCALQVDEGVGNELARAVVRDLPTPITRDNRYVARIVHVIRLTSQPLGEYCWVLAVPNLVWGVGVAGIGKRAHRIKRRLVGDYSQIFGVHRGRDLQHHLDHRVARKGSVKLVELRPVVHLHQQRDPLIVAAFAVAQFDCGFIKTRIELAGDVAQRRDKIWLRMPHHLDREVARVGYERVIGPCGHRRSESRKPSIIASRVADVISGRLDKSVDSRCKQFGFTRIIAD